MNVGEFYQKLVSPVFSQNVIVKAVKMRGSRAFCESNVGKYT